MSQTIAAKPTAVMEALGPKIRRRRVRRALTLDDLAAKTGISKPYLSLIETGKVVNPPSDEKLRKLEEALEFKRGELLSQAHLQRTPKDVRVFMQRLIEGKSRSPRDLKPPENSGGAVNLDEAYLSGVLAELVEKSSGNIEPVASNSVPVINRVSAGYPRDFTDLSYPRGVADAYVGCPDLSDPDAFAARVHGDSMTPKYKEGDIVVFSPCLDPKNGDDCFVRFSDGQTTFKRVFFEKDEAGDDVIRLQSRNEKYRARSVKSEEVSGLYKAVFRYERVSDE